MVATITRSTRSLLEQLQADFPGYTFTVAGTTAWNHKTQTISVAPDATPTDILHELGHALLGHTVYEHDVSLLEMERDAWGKARHIGVQYEVAIDEAAIAAHLDTYRDWLHARSTCPECQANGLQASPHTYRCIACDASWRVNDARQCQLRRYKQ